MSANNAHHACQESGSLGLCGWCDAPVATVRLHDLDFVTRWIVDSAIPGSEELARLRAAVSTHPSLVDAEEPYCWEINGPGADDDQGLYGTAYTAAARDLALRDYPDAHAVPLYRRPTERRTNA